jgi:hypothetical protein
MTHCLIAKLKPVIIFSLLLVFGLAGPVLAQSPITAEVDRTTLALDENLTLTVTVAGDFVNIPQPNLSGVTDFSVAGSGTSTQISFINGEMTSQGIYYYQLRPLQTGQLVIPPIGVTIDGQTYQTNPINIEVVESTGANSPSAPPAGSQAPETLAGQNFFVEAVVDNSNPYLGQQITFIFRFYQAADTQLQILGRPNYRPPAFTNFWGQTVLSQPYYSTYVDGREYFVTEVRTALFPANPGTLTIAPATLEIPGNLFAAGMLLETEPVSVAVQSLPEGAPEDFNGAVGQFDMQAQLDATAGKVNEPLTLLLDIEGTGNIDLLTEPQLPNLPGWRIFDSQSTSKTEVRDDAIFGRQRFERLLVPGESGEFTFPSIKFSYFDPQAGEYRTLETDPISVTIESDDSAGEPSVVVLDSANQPVQLAGGDIRHIKPVPTVLESSGSTLLGQPLYWAFWILPVFIVAGVWAWQGRRQRLLKDTAYARSHRARRAALKILSNAGQNDEDGYAAAQRALLGYLSDKLNRPTVGLTTDELVDLLRAQKLNPVLVEQVRATLTEIDASRFAPVEETAAQSLLAKTRQLINNLEKALGGKR